MWTAWSAQPPVNAVIYQAHPLRGQCRHAWCAHDMHLCMQARPTQSSCLQFSGETQSSLRTCNTCIKYSYQWSLQSVSWSYPAFKMSAILYVSFKMIEMMYLKLSHLILAWQTSYSNPTYSIRLSSTSCLQLKKSQNNGVRSVVPVSVCMNLR